MKTKFHASNYCTSFFNILSTPSFFHNQFIIRNYLPASNLLNILSKNGPKNGSSKLSI